MTTNRRACSQFASVRTVGTSKRDENRRNGRQMTTLSPAQLTSRGSESEPSLWAIKGAKCFPQGKSTWATVNSTYSVSLPLDPTVALDVYVAISRQIIRLWGEGARITSGRRQSRRAGMEARISVRHSRPVMLVSAEGERLVETLRFAAGRRVQA